MKELYSDLQELILSNRSLVENNPLNLLNKEEAKRVYFLVGQSRFIRLCHEILDDNE